VIRRQAVDVAGWAIVAGAALALSTQLIGTPSRHIATIQALTPWALPVLLAIVGWAARARRHAIGDAAALIAGGYLVVMLPLLWSPNGSRPAPDATHITVVAANVLYSNDHYDGIAATLTEVDADVVALAEVTPEIADALLARAVARQYPYRVVRAGDAASGLMLWSRYPLLDIGEVDVAWRSVAATIDGPDGRLRVVLLHPPPPVFNFEAWRSDLRALDDIATSSSLPLVVLGDLNASYFHPAFRSALSDAGLRDALRDSGDAMRFTWPTDEFLPAFVTLDHVLVNDRLAVVDGGVVDVPGSDHRAVIATVAVSG
jgi:endonuclease/exonuclease/phosphatase (EEP) superfamily protein YafD